MIDGDNLGNYLLEEIKRVDQEIVTAENSLKMLLGKKADLIKAAKAVGAINSKSSGNLNVKDTIVGIIRERPSTVGEIEGILYDKFRIFFRGRASVNAYLSRLKKAGVVVNKNCVWSIKEAE